MSTTRFSSNENNSETSGSKKTSADKHVDNFTFQDENLLKGFHTHFVYKLNKLPKEQKNPERDESTWYGKIVSSKFKAFREVTTQESFRLVIKRQTKTRILSGESNHPDSITHRMKNYQGGMVISKEVKNAQPLEHFKKEIKKNGYHPFKGLGELSLLALWVNHTDLHLENILVDNDKVLYEIDGDSGLRAPTSAHDDDFHDKNNTITPEIIKNLPFRPDPYPFGTWLDCKKNFFSFFPFQKKEYNSKTFSKDLRDDPIIRLEINQTILKIILLPDHLLQHFVASYSDNKSHCKLIHNELIKRKHQLFDAALQVESFIAYLVSDQSQNDLAEYLDYLKTFKTTGKNKLVDAPDAIENQMLEEFSSLQARFKTGLSNNN